MPNLCWLVGWFTFISRSQIDKHTVVVRSLATAPLYGWFKHFFSFFIWLLYHNIDTAGQMSHINCMSITPAMGRAKMQTSY